MTARDVAELWGFLSRNPDLHTNGYRLWEGIRAGMGGSEGKGKGKGKGRRERDDEAKVGMAIGRFRNAVPDGGR